MLERQVRLMGLKGFARGLNRASLSSVRLFLLSFHGFRKKKKKNLKNLKTVLNFRNFIEIDRRYYVETRETNLSEFL